MRINFNIGSTTLESDFLRIANELMNYWILQINNAKYRIAEIEFYYQSKSHDDKYTHGHILQLEPGNWYFHGSGLDLTIGAENISGGILIRAIWNLESKIYTYGPLNSVTELFSNLSNVYNRDFTFGLTEDTGKTIEIETPISAPRIGLNPKTAPHMYDKCYRFLVMPKQKHAEKTKIAEAMLRQGYDEDKINGIWA